MASLDITHKVLTTPPRLDALRALGNRAGTAVADMLGFSERFDLKQIWLGRGAPLHDPCTIAWLLKPELFEGRQINVEIEMASELTRGMTVCRFLEGHRPTQERQLSVRGSTLTAFYDLLTDRLGRLP